MATRLRPPPAADLLRGGRQSWRWLRFWFPAEGETLRMGRIVGIAAAVGVLAGPDLRLCELSTLMDGLRAHCQALKETFLGTSVEDSRAGALSVVVLAFGLPVAEAAQIGAEAPRPLSAKKGRGTRNTGSGLLRAAKSRFSDVSPTIVNGQNLDEPTYRRRGIRLAR